MTDEEKVIKGLECCITFDKTFECGTDCPYLPTCDAEVEPLDAPKCAGLQLHIDALELLKEQEAVVRCKDCKHILPKGFCHKHSRKVTDNWFCADGEQK